MIKAQEKTLNTLESSPYNGSNKKLSPKKEHKLEDTMKEKCGDTYPTAMLDEVDSYQYSAEMDLLMQEPASTCEDSDSNSFPYRSRCNTWPRLQPHLQHENDAISQSSDSERNKLNHLEFLEGTDSYIEPTIGNLSPAVTDTPNNSTKHTNVSSSFLYGRLQGLPSQQHSHLSFLDRRSYSPLADLPLTNQISGSYMLSQPSIQAMTCVKGIKGDNGDGIVDPIIRPSSATNQDEPLITTFTTSSLNSGPLPLLSEEDMVLDNDLMSFNKECSAAPESDASHHVTHKGSYNGELHDVAINTKMSSMECQTELSSNIDEETIAKTNTFGLKKEKESEDASNCVVPGIKPASLAQSGINTSSSSLSNLASSVGNCGANVSRRNAWGNLSYADLITQAIKSSPDQRLTLAQIYEWLVTNIAHFREKSDNVSSLGWKVRTSSFSILVLF